MPSITFLALLNEANKLEVYEKRMLLTIAAYPYMEKDTQETIRDNLVLPEDQLSDILESEETDDINILKEHLNANQSR